MFTDLSIDLETLGTDPGSVITQIGLCAFDPTLVNGPKSSILFRVEPQSCIDLGMTMSWSTIAWWLMQSAEAREGMQQCSNASRLPSVLTRMEQWLAEHFYREQPYNVWGYGANFDVTLLECAFKKVGFDVPWKYSQIRCGRTLVRQCPELTFEKSKKEHDAMADAIAQAEWIEQCLRHLKRTG